MKQYNVNYTLLHNEEQNLHISWKLLKCYVNVKKYHRFSNFSGKKNNKNSNNSLTLNPPPFKFAHFKLNGKQTNPTAN